MKQYIKSAVNPNMTLLDWVNQNQDTDFGFNRIMVYDETPDTDSNGNTNYIDDPMFDSYFYDCPGVIFEGTFEQLATGTGENYIVDPSYTEDMETEYSKYTVCDVRKEDDYITVYVIWG